MMEFSTIIFEKKDGVARITFNRPEVLNAISMVFVSEMGTVLDDIEKDESIKVVVIGAKGKAFCAGMDFADMKAALGSSIALERLARGVHEMHNTIENLSKPVICAVQGMALAGGLELSQACDIVIASENA
jgi:enoyl-CoA hydratase